MQESPSDQIEKNFESKKTDIRVGERASNVCTEKQDTKLQSVSIIDAALKLHYQFSFKSTKKSKVPGNDKIGGVAKKKRKFQYRQFLHRPTRKRKVA